MRLPVQPAQQAGSGERPANRAVENLVLMVFWLLIFEGALRKWVAPQFAQYIFFIRDPFVLLVYWYALRSGSFRGSGVLLQAGLAFAAVAVFLAFVQSVNFSNPRLLVVSAYGWRQYFLYLPLPFVMAATLSRDSLLRFARHACFAALLMAPLVVVQTSVSPTAVINRGIAEDESLQFQSFAYTGGRIRPSGTFTSSPGVKELVACTFAILLALWLTPRARRGVGLPLLVAATLATATCLAVSGARAAFIHCAVVVASSLVAGLVTRDPVVRARALSIPLLLVTAAILLYPIVFPGSFELFMGRVAEVAAVGGQSVGADLLGRAFADAIGFVDFLGHAPVMGYGLGLGGNGRMYLGASDPALMARIAAESDWSRHIVDLGILFGVMFIMYRVAFTMSLLAGAVKAASRSGDPLPVLLFGYVGINLFFGQLTGNGTVGGFTWLFLGLCMASIRAAVVRP